MVKHYYINTAQRKMGYKVQYSNPIDGSWWAEALPRIMTIGHKRLSEIRWSKNLEANFSDQLNSNDL